MFLSLRTRLWLSYALIIGILLLVVALALTQALIRNPTIYRSVLPRLREVESELMPKLRAALRGGEQRFQILLERDSLGREGVRTAVLDTDGSVVADNMAGVAGALPQLTPEEFPHLNAANRPGLIRDLRRRFWVYWTADIGQGYTLLVAITIPRLPVAQLLRNEVAAPLIYSGLIAILAASILALGMGSWIAAPLQRMVAASREMAAGRDVVLPEEGPGEVRQLARALNEMHRQAQISIHTQRDVLQSQRDFIANVSHELKTPLTSIQGFAQAVIDGTAQTPQAIRSAAEVIYNESNRMHRLVLDLLMLARLEGGTADLQRDRLDLSALLRSVAAKFSPQAAAARIDLLSDVPDLPVMIGDGDRLAQVFTNLVDNGLKFTPPGGQVGIRAEMVENGVRVEVWDTGKGIPETERERVFERFFQVEKSRRGGHDRGLGLGLPIARQIVLAHGGKIWIEAQHGSQPEGQIGCRLLVILPIARSDDTTLSIRR